MKNAGDYLKSIREEKGYSVQEVSRQTKISPAVLRALEEDRLKDIDQVYLKSFLKMYCRFLGVDWEGFQKEHPVSGPSVLKHAPKPHPAAQEKKEQASASGAVKPSFSGKAFRLKNRRIILIVLSLIAGALFLLLSFRGCMRVIKKLPRAKPSAERKIPQAPVTPSHKQTKASTFTQVKEPRTVKPVKPYPEVSQGVTVMPALAPAKESKPKDITLTISAQEDSFLKIKVDAKTVYQGSLRKGKAESWTAKDKIELSVGNAGGIVLEVNGKVFSPLGRRGQAIKNILINHEGLKVM